MMWMRGLALLLFSIIVFIAGFAVLAIDSEPSVNVDVSEQIRNADEVKNLLRQISDSLQKRTREQQIDVSEEQLLSIVGLLQRAKPAFHGDIAVTEARTLIAASVKLPINLASLYINVEIEVLPAAGLDVGYVKVGSLYLAGSAAVFLVESIVNKWTDSQIATQARQQITQVNMTDEKVVVHLKPLEAFLNYLNELQSGISPDTNDELKELTAYYLRYASYQDIALSNEPQLLVDYLRAVFRRAAQRSEPDSVVLHNKAAILGLAIFIGHHRIANFVGDVHPDAQRALKPAAPALLGGRNDLARHFIISAALKVLSEQGVSLAIGEFKELMDRAMGGSGYSFVDLMADMAGVKFANIATEPSTATQLQEIIADIADDKMLLPSYEALPEGLSKKQFEAQYQRVDSEAYRKRVNEIERRLAELSLYQLDPDFSFSQR
ncbi:hypothetical protein OPS25_12730 [Alteromonas ponticola]|uniref:Uncharacterized protein n=1 Tax=Alteromonas aquimaris TaxID=2998417 RepID=A0ABT3P9B0_9ALTE|nr:hypothetical protein [Alteromonas aquimaris]MCW8109367.1 hypothetical protein [Alteromonas aquimaris]